MQKIKSMVTVNNFTRNKPRVLRQYGPQLAPKIMKPTPHPQLRQQKPNQITIKKPIRVITQQLKKQEQKITQTPKTIQTVKTIQTHRPNKSLLQQQLSNIRSQAPKKTNTQIINNNRTRSINTKAVSQLLNIGVGRTLVMIAAGPSVLEVDFGPIKGHKLIDFMCINKPFKPVWPSKFWVFCDHTQQRANKEIWDTYDDIIINSPNVRARKSNQIIIKAKPGRGFSRDIVQGYHIGRSSTYANLQVAYYMGYKRIYCFGLDMNDVNGRLYHYGDGKNPDVPSDIRKSRFPAEAMHFLHGAQALTSDERKRFVICSSINTWEFTKYFEKWDHKEAIQKIIESI